jgi:hypothetical protein
MIIALDRVFDHPIAIFVTMFLFTMCFTPFQVSAKGRCKKAKKSKRQLN